MNSRFSSIPVTETGKIQKLVVEYLKRNPSLKSLYKFEPEIDSIEKAILLKRSFPSTSREILSASLKSQYDEAGMLTSELEEHIDSLKSSDTFTITTGQQNGILLGPLYTVLKICSAISLADELTKRYPEKKFIPVFWMATEDHDIEEIRSVSVMAEKYKWETKQTGAAGRLSNEGLQEIIAWIKADLQGSDDVNSFIEICNHAYSLKNLSEATRYLVHQLFYKKRILIIDADRKELKQVFSKIIEKDILQQISFNESKKAISILDKQFNVQVNGREINFFYLKDEYRERLEKYKSGFRTIDAKHNFTEDEIKAEIRNHPECFSPNVMMRPLYQETILPNLAYFGGGAEISYWLELKPVFDAFETAFPLLMLRNSAMIIDRKNHHRFVNNKLSDKDLFLPLEILERRFVIQQSPEDLELKAELQMLNEWIKRLSAKASTIHPSLINSAEALGTRFRHQTNRFSLKLIREAKRKERLHEGRINALYSYIYPKGKLQERQESLLSYINEFGIGFLDDLLETQAPAGNSFILMFY